MAEGGGAGTVSLCGHCVFGAFLGGANGLQEEEEWVETDRWDPGSTYNVVGDTSRSRVFLGA